MGWKKLFVGEKMPDKDNPKYKQRYENEVNAGRKFARMMKLDVLAGTVASLVSRGINETVASAMAVYIHGLAGDIAKDKYGIESVTASKVMECIPCALRQILQVEN